MSKVTSLRDSPYIDAMTDAPFLAQTPAAIAHLTDQLGQAGFCDALYAAISTVLQSDNCIVIAYKGTLPPHVLFRSFKTPTAFAQIDSKYVASHYMLDPFYAAHLRKAPRGVYRLQDIAPDQFHQTTYFLEYYRQTTFEDEIGLFAYAQTGWTITACVGRDEGSGLPFDAGQLAVLDRISPVLVALMEQHWANFGPDESPLHADGNIAEDLARSLCVEKGIELTPRQIEIGLLILQGHSSRSIGLILGISWQTVKVFRKQLYARCQVSSQAELFALLLPLIGAVRADVSA